MSGGGAGGRRGGSRRGHRPEAEIGEDMRVSGLVTCEEVWAEVRRGTYDSGGSPLEVLVLQQQNNDA